jgi:hypothetical protein
MDTITAAAAAVAKPITSAKSANDLADLLVAPPEDTTGNLMRNKGSDIDLNSLYQQSQQQQQFGFGMSMGMGMMQPGGNMRQQAPNFNAQQANNMSANKMFHIGSPQNNGFMGNPINNSNSVPLGNMFGQNNVRPARSAPQPPQLNVNSSALNLGNFNHIQQPNANQMSMTNGQLFPQQQTITPNNSPMPSGTTNPFQLNSPGMTPQQQSFQNQSTFPPGPSIIPNPNLASGSSHPDLSLLSVFSATELPMVDPAVTVPGQDPFAPKVSNNVDTSTTNNQLAIGGGLNIGFPKSMSTSSFMSTTEPGSIDLSGSITGSLDLQPLNSTNESNNSTPNTESVTEEDKSKKKFGGFQFLLRNSEVVEGVIEVKEKSKESGKTDTTDGLEPISIPDENESGIKSPENNASVNVTNTVESEKEKNSENENNEDSKDNIGKHCTSYILQNLLLLSAVHYIFAQRENVKTFTN